MFGSQRSRTAPTPYPRLVFHGIRLGQTLASLVVMSVMYFFIWNLVHEDYEPPRTFWTLLAASLCTLAFLVATTVLYACTKLSPLLNLVGNAVLFLLWGPAFGYLWYYSRATLGHVCNKDTWTGPTGIMVCRIYKALFAFSMLGTLTTLLALLLDVFIWRKTVARGKYSQMKEKPPVGIAAPGQPYTAPAYSDSRNSMSLDAYTTPSTARGDQSGYQVPEDQFSYDTSYQGGHHAETSRA